MNHYRPEPTRADDTARRRSSRPADLGSLEDFWALLRRRWLVIAAVFVLTTGAVVGASLLLPPSWTAQTTIMVKQGREFFYRAEVGDATGRPLLSLAEMVNSQVEILSSRDLAEQVIRDLGLERVYPEMVAEPGADPQRLMPAAVTRFQDNLVVMDVLESSIIRISYENRDPLVAAEALNNLIDRFKEKHADVFAEPAAGFMSDKLQQYQARLAASEDALEHFRRQHGVFELAQQRTLLLNRKAELDAELQAAAFRIAEISQTMQLLNGRPLSAETPDPPPPVSEDRASLVARRAELSSALQEAEMRLAELRQQLLVFKDGSEGQDGDEPGAWPGADRFRSLDEAFIRLLDLQLKEKELLRNYSQESRLVTGVRQEIALVEAFLRERGTFVREVIEATIRDEVEGLVARRSAAASQIQAVDAQVRAVDLRLALDELAPLEARTSRIRQEMGRFDEELARIDGLDKELRRLQRQLALDESNYQAFLGRSEDARLMEELDRAKLVNIAVIETAAPPASPSSLSPKLRALIGAAVGLFAGLAAAVFLELISRS